MGVCSSFASDGSTTSLHYHRAPSLLTLGPPGAQFNCPQRYQGQTVLGTDNLFVSTISNIIHNKRFSFLKFKIFKYGKRKLYNSDVPEDKLKKIIYSQHE